MKIAIFDIDDTIVEETGFMLKHAKKFLQKEFNINAKIVNPDGYDIKEVYDLVGYLKNKGYSAEEAIKQSGKINQDFWNSNFVKYCREPIKPGVKETVEILKKNGYKVMFVSLRGKSTSNNSSKIDDFVRLQIVPFLTSSQLSRGNIEYDSIKLVKTQQDKIDFINSMNPDYVFEDQPDVIKEIQSKSKIFCVSTSHNKKIKLQDNIIRLDEFNPQKIEEIITQDFVKEEQTKRRKTPIQKSLVTDFSIKNPKYLRKILTESAYSIVSKIGTPITLASYHPIVKGKENILKDGAVAFVGNHRNKMDPVMLAVTSNRNIHWGALLRMFQGKENLFSSGKHPIPCYLSAAFITAVGAVPIARDTDKDCQKINIESIKSLYQILQWQGAIGLFPEGTINRKPEEQNILPLKSERVFKMAVDMDGIVQPFSVVWIPENINVENKMIINYGLPINTRNRTSKEVSKIWQNDVNNGIEESKKLIIEMEKIDKSNIEQEEKQSEIKTLVKKFINK